MPPLPSRADGEWGYLHPVTRSADLCAAGLDAFRIFTEGAAAAGIEFLAKPEMRLERSSVKHKFWAGGSLTIHHLAWRVSAPFRRTNR